MLLGQPYMIHIHTGVYMLLGQPLMIHTFKHMSSVQRRQIILSYGEN